MNPAGIVVRADVDALLLGRPADPVQARGHQLVAGTGDQLRLVDLQTAGELADALSRNTRLHPGASSASSWASGFWSRVETRE